MKISCRPNIGLWGVYPEAMACNVGGLYSDFNLGERILFYSESALLVIGSPCDSSTTKQKSDHLQSPVYTAVTSVNNVSLNFFSI